MKLKFSNESGSVMIITLVVSSIILLLLVAFAGSINYQVRQSAKTRRQIQGSYIAEGAISRATYTISQDVNWRSGYTNQSLGGGTYNVQVVDLGSDFLRLDATAIIGGESFPLSVRLKPIYKAFPTMNFGAFGDSGISLGDGKLYSYDSTLNSTPDTDNPGNDGDAGTNSKLASTITISANSVVYGDLITGSGSDPNSVVSAHPNATISGEKKAATESQPFPKVKIPNSAVAMGALNTSVTLASGVYHFTSINLAGSDYLKTTGPVQIYVSESISIGGNGEKHAQSYKPEDLRIYATNSVNSISLSGNATFYGIIYAPKADIALNGGGSHGIVAGAISGKNVTFNGSNTKIYYDVHLRQLSGEQLDSGEVLRYETSAFWRG